MGQPPERTRVALQEERKPLSVAPRAEPEGLKNDQPSEFMPPWGHGQLMGLAMSSTLKLLLARFPGAIQIPLAAAAEACSMSVQTARNQLVSGAFPIKTHKLGGRRMVRLDDLASYLDAVSGAGKPLQAASRGRPSKTERLEAERQGITVRELRAQRAAETAGGAQ